MYYLRVQAAILKTCLEDTDTWPGPATLPDLSLIVDAWNNIGRAINTPALLHNLKELHESIQAAWDGFSQDTIQKFYNSMLGRLACCVSEHGGPAPY